MAPTVKKAGKRKPVAPSRRTAKRAPAKAKPRTTKRPVEAEDESKVFPIEVEAGSIERTLTRVREELAHWVKKGRYTKVRFKLRGKPLLPDIPVGAMLAAEAMTFWWAGILRVLLVNIGAKAVLDVELVNDAELEVGRGKQAVLAGDLDKAIESFNKAVEMDRDCATAQLNLGIARKLKGELEKAREHLERAEQLDAQGATGEEARRLLDQLGARQPPSPG